MRTYDALIVGAGHNGLTAAAYLARAGLSTLVLERREIVGGCAVTEEVDPVAAPGCRVSTASYIASMLRPEVIRDLGLARYGLRMVRCEPAVQVALPQGRLIPWWNERARLEAELAAIDAGDARRFLALDDRLKALARYLQPFFLESPPDPYARGWRRWRELLRLGRRLRGIDGDGIADMIELLTGSVADVVDRHLETDELKALVLANTLYGQHGGPQQPGTAMGLLFHLLSGGEQQRQGWFGHVIGGMGAITQAMAAAAREFGAEIRTAATVARIDVRDGSARGVVLEDGTELRARVVLSNADPKRTFLGLLESGELDESFRQRIAAIRMDGPCGKVNFVLSEEPRLRGMPADADPGRRALFTLVPGYDTAQRGYEAARAGRIADELWVDCVVASNVDPTLAPEGRHVLSCFVQYLPYRLADGDWPRRREQLGDRVLARIAEYAPNVPGAVIARRVFTPYDLEQTFAITEGNIFHGDIALQQLVFMRPVPGWSGYRTPIERLYLCGAGAHPGGGVTGAPGYNAARRVLADWRRGRWGKRSPSPRPSRRKRGEGVDPSPRPSRRGRGEGEAR